MYKLLLVEDEDLVRNGIKRFVSFGELNIDRIYEAANGEEGLRVFREQLPDLVLLDINMPRMNGLDFAAKIKELKPEVKIAVITGYDYYDYAVAALKIGIDDYVLKPVSRNDVFEVLSKLVNKLRNEGQQAELLALLKDFRSAASEAGEDAAGEAGGGKRLIAHFIEDNMSNPEFSLTVLAELMGFSPGYMSTLFKKHFNVSFQDHIAAVRLERAKLQLLASDKKVYEISTEVGFDNPNYFSAAFKKKYGMSPLQYRERIKE
ncbi:response regulator [Paenibacillus doosanensis]|uniref:Response regulatory protein n=1 Tax=Paenibacillus konkukensis TaxID=2020716 RepID=A0ABY4RYV4_9BACL|nr:MULTISPECIES: response regulator [Paenibacillus]MCS7460472.1 response regulator [Paenibacillus doosanensis]UQZ87501.1 putative response regulatory protein [Paenibacillus konkukensis]